jgi:serine/threonine protein kinase
LHHFHIVHVDIKPDNIMYSSKKRKLVFIDFGFSKIVEEDIGFNSKSTFSGSVLFCGKEMAKLFHASDPTVINFIDIYYNDV